MPIDGAAFWVLALLAAGMGGIFLWTDWDNRASRALALCLLFIGLRLALAPLQREVGVPGDLLFVAMTRTLEAMSILLGIEWARRVGQESGTRLRRTINVLFRVSQGMVLLYGLMTLGYLLIAPEDASTDAAGLIRVRAVEWAVFAPILGTAVLLSSIAMLLARFSRRDPVESIRMRALALSTPFLLAGLVVEQSLVPMIMAVGLLIFLSGSVRFLIIQARHGQSMRQFLSPQVARMLSAQGMERAMRRERREISVVVCDLRGFTAYARERSSDEVMTLLERYYRLAGDVAQQFGGTVKDHAGDGVLILVGAPLPDPAHARNAALLALNLSRCVSEFLQQSAPTLSVGVGVTTGEATIGAIHGAGRLEYVAIGTVVNLAARLCQRAAPAEVLSDGPTQTAVRQKDGMSAQAREPEALKGFSEPVPVYSLEQAALPAERKSARGSKVSS